MADDGRFFPALACLMDEGAGLLIGTADADGTPRATRGWGVRLDADGRLRVIVGADDPTVVANLHDRVVAVTTASVRTLKSVQLKGPVLAIDDPDADDLAAVEAQTDQFVRGIVETDGYPEHIVRRLVPDRYLSIVIDVGAGFDQTPGPAAGAALGTGT
jgi:hypothetical protein